MDKIKRDKKIPLIIARADISGMCSISAKKIVKNPVRDLRTFDKLFLFENFRKRKWSYQVVKHFFKISLKWQQIYGDYIESWKSYICLECDLFLWMKAKWNLVLASSLIKR